MVAAYECDRLGVAPRTTGPEAARETILDEWLPFDPTGHGSTLEGLTWSECGDRRRRGSQGRPCQESSHDPIWLLAGDQAIGMPTEKAAAKSKLRGIMFLRLNYFNDPKKTDANMRFWQKLIFGLRDQLVADGAIQAHQLQFIGARTPEEAARWLKYARDRGYEPVLSSHGQPVSEDVKAMFGEIAYLKEDFFQAMNKQLGTDFLTDKTVWYSCDPEVGAIKPTDSFERRVRPYLENRLWEINH